MRGHTEDTTHIWVFDPGFISELVRAVSIPVIAEGRIWTREAMDGPANLRFKTRSWDTSAV